jgi:serine/threonine-protein kinase
MEVEDETKVVERDLSPDADASDDEPDPPAPSADSPEPTSDPDGARRSRASGTGLDLIAAHRLVGRYELIHRLGHGGMATVYLGRAIGTAGFERLVAVKVIHPHLASEPEFVEMFLDEARIAAKIHHPHVVEIMDLGEDDDLFFMVMEYVEGDTLASLLRELRKREEQLALPAALQVVSDVCRGLAAAHDLKELDGRPVELVHRDVSPHNFLISMDGRVRVVDFGIMKAAGKRSTTLTGQLRGKVPYMSPEQAKAKPVDHRTDIFALGAVFWEMLAGERLFAGETESETLARVMQCSVPDILERRPELPEYIRPILKKSLAIDPDERYDSAKVMLKDIRAALRKHDEDDPREVLAGYMKRFFEGRIEYIHATIRGHAAGDMAGRTGGSAGDLTLGKTTPHGPSSSPGSRFTPSNPPLGPQTLTTGVGSPARQWTLWLLLPLAGAVIGTMVVRTWDRDEPVEQRAAPTTNDATPASAQARTPAATEERPAPLKAVTWWFNTDPQGATIFVDGERQGDPTPVRIELPRGDDPVTVRVEKEGFVPRELRLAPLGNENHQLALQPVAAETPPETRTPIGPRFTARPKKPSKPAPDAAPPPDPETPKGETGDDVLSGPPNFDLLKKKKKTP